MHCPVCGQELNEIDVQGTKLDVCSSSCGGVWFDARELERVEQIEGTLPDHVLRPLKNQSVVVDRSKERKCPRCPESLMWRKLEGAEQQVEIDCCPSCGGIWLDLGELQALCSHFKDESSRQLIIDRAAALAGTSAEAKIPERLKAVFKLLF